MILCLKIFKLKINTISLILQDEKQNIVLLRPGPDHQSA